jgi:hypothetical protein
MRFASSIPTTTASLVHQIALTRRRGCPGRSPGMMRRVWLLLRLEANQPLGKIVMRLLPDALA